ncbi:MAG: ABC transporter permease subunit [Candidatus Kapabacteria bacterium]|nr:ABC transporter permease subunit [Ignavibacteriota bacterium]MCW5883822.1 ABC transporter permease subunit [Candidatus Kapabacteria bacterium]
MLPEFKNKKFLKFNSLISAKFSDKFATFIIYSGGLVTIIAVIGILAFVLWEAFPLISKTTSSKTAEIKLHNFSNNPKALLTGVDEYKEIAYILNDKGYIDFFDMSENELIKRVEIDSIYGKQISSCSKSLNDNYVALGTSDGYIAAIFIAYSISFDVNSLRIIEPKIELVDYFLADTNRLPIKKSIFRAPYQDLKTIFYQNSDNKLFLKSFNIDRNFLTGDESVDIFTADIPLSTNDIITSVNIDDMSEKLLIGTLSGKILYYSLKNPYNPQYIQIIHDFNNPITSLTFILGDQTFVVGNSKGELESYTHYQDSDNHHGWKFVKFKKFQSHNAPITSIAVSSRNKSFIVGDNIGDIFLYHLTTGDRILDLNGRTNHKVIDLAFAPKADGASALLSDGSLFNFDIEGQHTEFTFKTVFGKVLYEGYKDADYVWQSTGGTDDFEPKFSLMPLLFGTLKGTFFALLFAVPIALLGAIYTALFMNKKVRDFIKPTIEMMAALPSVVIGFLAGIWLAPILDKFLPAMNLFIIISLLLTTIVFIINFLQVKNNERIFIREGYEIAAIIPVILISGFAAYLLGDFVEVGFFGGDFKLWLLNNFDIQYEQRNGIVVGFALGFAVIPIIYTISEDSLHNVPKSLTSAAFALGADKWQTARRVIIPTASPGIFSAIMIGFGRAIGETMIVLMATGNTPIMDWSIFNGMRTLSANIAIEIPEAPVGGTLYRVLFLSASLLFVITFIINTAAELVRQKLRRKYQNL